MLLTLDPYQPADFAGVSHRSLADFLRGAPLVGQWDRRGDGHGRVV